jgi:hypothetical protein
LSANSWKDFLDTLLPCEALIEQSWMAGEPQFQAEYHRQLAAHLSIGYFLYFNGDPDHPDWTPLFNQVQAAQPNPDDTYYWSSLRGDGTYRVYGDRGNVHMIMFTVANDLMGMSEPCGPTLGVFDLAEMQIGADGAFEIILSRDRPPGYAGNWIPLDPRVNYILVRQRHYDWAHETGTRIAIEALHPAPPKPRMSIAETRAKLGELALFAQRLSRVFFQYHNRLRDKGLINKVEHTSFADLGGGFFTKTGGQKQVYWQGIFEFGPGEAIIIDSDMPEKVGYWNIQVNDLLFNTVEYVYRQSSINGFQAALSPDGRLWAVLSVEDPGVANWLDTAGYYEGVVVGRWLDFSSAPTPSMRRVRLSEVHSLLPAHTPMVSPEQRAASIRARVKGHQMRRRW